jgi:hypothetical protein
MKSRANPLIGAAFHGPAPLAIRASACFEQRAGESLAIRDMRRL